MIAAAAARAAPAAVVPGRADPVEADPVVAPAAARVDASPMGRSVARAVRAVSATVVGSGTTVTTVESVLLGATKSVLQNESATTDRRFRKRSPVVSWTARSQRS
jgi:hypothetical protein